MYKTFATELIDAQYVINDVTIYFGKLRIEEPLLAVKHCALVLKSLFFASV